MNKLAKRAYRKIFGKNAKKAPPAFLGKPKELFGVGERNGAAVVYIGNGAKGNAYQEEIKARGLDGKAYSGMGGIYNECAIIYAPLQSDGSINAGVVEAFSHPSEEAVFAGFSLRKKEDGKWLWYVEDGTWHQDYADAEKKLFFEGDQLPKAESDAASVVYLLTAQWADAEGRPMNCGYRMFRNDMMAHALGGLDGHVYLNTFAAMENSIARGFHYLETDFTLTKDDRLVVCHGWTERDCMRYGIPYDPAYQEMTYDMARQLRVHGEPVPDTREFYEYIKALPEDYLFEIDYHDVKGEKPKKITKYFIEDFQNDEEVFRRLLIQIYSPMMFAMVDSIHRFEIYQYCIQKDIGILDDTIQFCLDNGICAIAIRAAEASHENIRKLKFAGLHILAFTVNKDLTYARTVLENGADTICTNFISEDEIRNHWITMKEQPYYIGIPAASVRGEIPTADDMAEDDRVYYEVSNTSPNTSVPELSEPVSEKEGPFRGWALRRTLDGATHWYCEDGFFRKVTKLKPGTVRDMKIFASGDELPVFEVKEREKLRLVPKWEEAENRESVK